MEGSRPAGNSTGSSKSWRGFTRAISHGEGSPEQIALHPLLSTLVKEDDDRAYPMPAGDPLQILSCLMDQRGLRVADLAPIFGARSIASTGAEWQAGTAQDPHAKTCRILSRVTRDLSGSLTPLPFAEFNALPPSILPACTRPQIEVAR